jgi:hypothetical protein
MRRLADDAALRQAILEHQTDISEETMPTASFTYKLKPGVSRQTYEDWVVAFDYPHVEQIPSIVSQRIYRIEEAVFGNTEPPYNYLEVIEFTNVSDYLNDLTNHPAAQAIASEMPNFVEMVSNSFAAFIPPGVS